MPPPPHKLDVGKNRLRRLVSASTEAAPRLPLVHTTDAYFFEDILDEQEITPQPCPVFTGEALTYLFYGRPAFRPNLHAEPTSLKHYFPVCLIFKPEWSPTLRRVFPFDTGAFHNEFYGAYLHKRMKLGDFGLEPFAETPGKVISRFFGSVPAYLTAAPQATSRPDPSEFEAESYIALINAKDGNAIDSRGSGVEVQIDETISIVDALSAVILPQNFVQGATGAALKKLGITPISYRVHERTRPNEYMSEITSLTFNYYLQIGLVPEGSL